MSIDHTTEKILIATDISKTVATIDGPLTILSGISFSLKPSETLAIVGVSGAGKSTLLGILAGLDTPTSGSVELCGQRLDLLDEDGRAAVRAGNLGFVFQSFQLLPTLTALENVLLPLEVLGQKNSEAIALNFLARVGLENRVNHYPRQLSGGEQQRVAIARAFVSRPKILFADEPTGNLDAKTGAKIIDLLFDLNRDEGATLVLITHDPPIAERCGHHLEMSAGELVDID